MALLRIFFIYCISAAFVGAFESVQNSFVVSVVLGTVLNVLYYAVAVLVYKQSYYYKSTRCTYLQKTFNIGRSIEYTIYKALRALKGKKRFVFEMKIPSFDENAHDVGVVMIDACGVHIFSWCTEVGTIKGKESQGSWTLTLQQGKKGTAKQGFENPAARVLAYGNWLGAYLREFENAEIFCYLVFSDNCDIKDIELSSENLLATRKKDVAKAVWLNSEYKNDDKRVLSDKEIDSAFEKLKLLAGTGRDED